MSKIKQQKKKSTREFSNCKKEFFINVAAIQKIANIYDIIRGITQSHTFHNKNKEKLN